MRRRHGNKRGDDFKMQFNQLNQRKCKDCMDYVNMKMSRMESFFFLEQEPNYYKGKITGLDPQHTFHAQGENCRAYIYALKFVPVLFDSESSDGDTCTTLWITKDLDIPKVNVVSSYWAGSEPEPPSKLTETIPKAARLNNELLIGMDSNAHTDIIGSDYTDARGSKLEQLICSGI